MEMGQRKENIRFAYLGRQLRGHHEAAKAAFKEIFDLAKKSGDIGGAA